MGLTRERCRINIIHVKTSQLPIVIASGFNGDPRIGFMDAHVELSASRSESSAALIASRDDDWMGRLRDAIQKEYGLTVTTIVVAPRGYYAETWKFTSGARDYFVKLDSTGHQQRLRASLPVIDHLWNHGIRFINHPIHTVNGHLYSEFSGGTLAIFDWITGHNVETDAAKPAEYDMLAQVYALSLGDVTVPQLHFSRDLADRFFAIWNGLERGSDVDNMLEAHRDVIELRASRLSMLAEICQGDQSGFVLTHGDAGGNFMTDGDHCYIVDWDEVQLAPPERDAWVTCTKPWARTIFDDALQRHGINYVLQPERIAYFCYHMLFFYLSEVLSGVNKSDPAVEIRDLLDGWTKGRMKWADALEIGSNPS